ncbi:MAG TPA: sulfite reductase subunit A, partial [Ignavibacteria bacterium]|nr:sulfite reductase subunit A [Ignavibacteria bacterium]
MKILDKINLEKLIGILKQDGYKVIGPVIKDGVILYDEIDSIKDLPAGWEDEQDAASYRLKKTNERSLFSYVVGPQSWKKFIFPQRLTLWKAKREGRSFKVNTAADPAPKYAFFGVRSCELSSILIQDRVFNNGMFADSYYNNVRNNVLIISVNCTRSAGTCFCVSMKTGPKAKSGFDL